MKEGSIPDAERPRARFAGPHCPRVEPPRTCSSRTGRGRDEHPPSQGCKVTRVLSNLNLNPRLQSAILFHSFALTEPQELCWQSMVSAPEVLDPSKEIRTTPFSSNVCLRALASRTLTFGTGSDARLSRLGSKCSTNWSTGMHSSSTTAYETNTQQKKQDLC